MNQKTLVRPQSPLSFIALILVLGACALTIILTGSKFGFFTAPGCGEGSGCDAITKGPWGTIKYINWPVSFLGVAWFTGLFASWLRRGADSSLFIWIVRVGVVASVGFIGVMVGEGTFCKWCLLTHLCNILFWVIAEILKKRNIVGSAGVFLITFILATTALIAGWMLLPTFGKTVGESAKRFLVGDHHIGALDAPIQVVMFTDYQCPDCKRIENQLATIMRTQDDVAVTIKHFPLCFDCNDNIGKFKLHANACWAARAAETASMLGGGDGWEKMHAWLFSQGGSFTDKTFPPSLTAMGFDSEEFIKVMKSDAMLQRVKEDADDGFALGVFFTPMVFINGKEYLWYYGAEGSIASVINAVRVDLQSGGGETVVPPNADEKLVEDWRRGRRWNLPGSDRLSWEGDGDIDFVVWGDYQTTLTVELEIEIRKAMQKNPNIRYAFRHFPGDKECNPYVGDMAKNYDGSCFLAKLVEAVTLLTSDETRWKMHQWILQQDKPLRQTTALNQAVEYSSIDQSIIQDVMRSLDVSERLRIDLLTKNSVWRRSMPVLLIDGRYVPRWRSDAVEAGTLFQRIVDVVESGD